MSSAAIFGSTGLVGSHILSNILNLEHWTTIHTISRRAPKSEGPKLQALIEPDTAQWTTKLAALTPPPTTVFSAVGTTRAQAGGIKEQWKIDHDLNVDIAKAAKEAVGAKTFVFISSAGIRGMLGGYVPYSKMKQGVEDAIGDLGFEHAVILRPGLIMGAREVEHTGGPLMNMIARGLGRVSQSLQDGIGQDAEVIARAAVQAARMADEGKAPSKYWILESDDILKLGRDEWKN